VKVRASTTWKTSPARMYSFAFSTLIMYAVSLIETATCSGWASGSGAGSGVSSGPCVISQAQRSMAFFERPAMVSVCFRLSKTTTVASLMMRARGARRAGIHLVNGWTAS
jgi:hypothetical protein